MPMDKELPFHMLRNKMTMVPIHSKMDICSHCKFPFDCPLPCRDCMAQFPLQLLVLDRVLFSALFHPHKSLNRSPTLTIQPSFRTLGQRGTFLPLYHSQHTDNHRLFQQFCTLDLAKYLHQVHSCTPKNSQNSPAKLIFTF